MNLTRDSMEAITTALASIGATESDVPAKKFTFQVFRVPFHVEGFDITGDGARAGPAPRY